MEVKTHPIQNPIQYEFLIKLSKKNLSKIKSFEKNPLKKGNPINLKLAIRQKLKVKEEKFSKKLIFRKS